MAQVILFTDRSPLTRELQGTSIQLERYSRAAGAYKVASVLRSKGYEVLVVPNCLRLTLRAIKNLIDQHASTLLWIGVSTTFLTIKSNNIDEYRTLWRESSEDFLNLNVLTNLTYITTAVTQLAWGTDELTALADYAFKKSNAHLMIGGTWVSHIKKGALNLSSPFIHFSVGYTEDFIVDFTNALSNKTTVPQSYEGEKEFKSSSIIYTPNDHILPDEWLTLEVSRGCAFKCAYCTYDHKGKSDTTKYTKTLLDELIRNYELFGVTKYHLLDDLYNDSDHKIKTLYDEVWSKLPFTPEWVSYLRLDLIWSNPESAQWLMESGCKLGCFGIETLHDKAGKFVGKGLGRSRIIETLEHLRSVWKQDVLINALMIAGLPWEPYDSILETMAWLKTTPLVDSYKYSALWVTPPEHKHIVIKTNSMSNDYEKYQLTWGEDGWVNNVGVSFKQVAKLVEKDDREYFDNFYPADLIEYPELRTIGYDHSMLADKNQNNVIIKNILNSNYPIDNLITDRMKKILA